MDADESPAVVDLSEAEFVDAYAMVGLACLIARRMQDVGDVEVRAPARDPSIYLSRMGFQQLLDGLGVPIDRRLPTIRHTDHRGFLVELTQFFDTHGGERIASIVWQRLAGNVPASVAEGMHEGTSELGANVYEHAESAAGGFVAAQTYLRDQPQESLLIAVGDSGVGLAATLARRLGPLSDREAVEQALERDVSGTDDPGRGQGLADVVEFTQVHGGMVAVQSGQARCIVRGRSRRVQNVSHFPGTLIGASVPCRPRERGGYR